MDQRASQRGLRRSREEMYALLAVYVESGQTQASFCAGHGLKLATFQYWWRRYRQSQGGEAAGFVALEPEMAVWESAPCLELSYGGVVLGLKGAGPGYVAELVRQLAGPC